MSSGDTIKITQSTVNLVILNDRSKLLLVIGNTNCNQDCFSVISDLFRTVNVQEKISRLLPRIINKIDQYICYSTNGAKSSKYGDN